MAKVVLKHLDKRYPNGFAANPFYQHRAPDKLPSGVRVYLVECDT